MFPELYQKLTDAELKERISKAKERLGKRLVILGHHYQREEVIRFADFKGDSFGLSKIASEQKEAEFIVFCGVHFMAEAAKILARPKQKVYLPDMTAGCPMADMASVDEVEDAWVILSEMMDIGKVIPITYMNSVAALKAFCGRNNGIVCTSSNAPKAFEWAFAKGNTVFFFPDEHLGRNTARKLGIKGEEISMWDKTRVPEYQSARVLIWPGFCHVHTHFTVADVGEACKKYPDCKIIVHPECREEVIIAAGESGSTEEICKFVERQQKGVTIIVGTEINLISRLAKENPDKNILPLSRSLCPNMFKISLKNLCYVLDSITEGNFVNEITLSSDVMGDARVALQRMLKL